MNTTSFETPSALPSHRALEQAAHWFAVLGSGDATVADHERWQRWLAESGEHTLAWGYVESISRRFDPIKASPERRTAVAAFQQASSNRTPRRRTLLNLAALAGTGLFGWAAWQRSPLPAMTQAWLADYRTDTGEIRQVVLADGTCVWLNARSAFSQDYRLDQRRLTLVQGEILIETAPDALHRPFFVHTSQGRLQALGTRFTVRLNDADTFVAVYEGAVEVRAAAGQTRIVARGEQTRFTTDGIGDIQAADPARQAWVHGLLVARNLPLAEVIDELRRYFHGHLSLAPELAALPVFGGYPVNDPERALSMLASVMPIRVRRPMPWWISIEPRQ